MKPRQLEKISCMLAPGENLIAAIPCGNIRIEPGGSKEGGVRDYLVLTDKRLIDIKGQYFTHGAGFTAYPRRMCADASMKPFAMGTSIKVTVRDKQKPEETIELEFLNLKKTDAEIIVRELASGAVKKVVKCPRCSRIPDKDYTFCPACGTPLKHLCPRCGKPVPDSGKCPACAGA